MAPAAVQRLGHFLQRQIGKTHRHFHFPAEIGGQRHVLVCQPQSEGRRVVFVHQELIDQPLEHTAAPQGALAHGFPDRQGFHPGLHTHCEHLRQSGGGDVAHAIMHQLRHRTGPDRTDIEGGVGKTIEHMLVLVEYLPIPANPDRHLAGGRTRWAAADRRIERMDAAFLILRRDLADQRRRTGRQIEIGRAWLKTFDQAVLAHCHGFHFERAGQGRENHIRLFRHLPGRRRPNRAGRDKPRRRLLVDVVDHQIEAVLLQVVHHAGTHGADTDKAYFHGFASNTSRAMLAAVMAAGQPA